MIDQQFPAELLEWREVGIVRPQNSNGRRQQRQIGREIKCPIVVVRILIVRKRQIFQKARNVRKPFRVRRRRCRPGDRFSPAIRPIFVAQRKSRRDQFAVRVVRPRGDFLEAIHLSRRQAIRRVAFRAQQRRGVESAIARIVDQAIHQSVLAVAFRQNRGRNQRQLVSRNKMIGARKNRLVDPDAIERPVDRKRRIARDNAVEVAGKALRFHQRLAAAIGAGIEIGFRLGLAVVGQDDLLRKLGGEMHRAPPEILHLLRMAKGPAGIAGFRAMTGVGTSDGKTADEITGHLAHADGTSESAIACAEKAAVPILTRQPDFEVDCRVAGGSQHAGNATERGQMLERRDAGNGQRARRYGFRHGDGGVLQPEALQRGAVRSMQ